MSKTKRNRYSGEFKAKIAREAMREGSTIVEIAARYNIHPNQVSEWKKQAQHYKTVQPASNQPLVMVLRSNGRISTESGVDAPN